MRFDHNGPAKGECVGTLRWSHIDRFPALPPWPRDPDRPKYPRGPQLLDNWFTYLEHRIPANDKGEIRIEPPMIDGLSYVLSLVYASQRLRMKPPDPGPLTFIIAGASSRAEERLLRETTYWEELTHFMPDCKKIVLIFCGPEIDHARHNVRSEHGPRMSARCFHGTLGELLRAEPTNFTAEDTIVVGFNPGFGNTSAGMARGGFTLMQSWLPDLCALLARGLCAIFTCANDYSDLRGEIAIFQQLLKADIVLAPTKNPFKVWGGMRAHPRTHAHARIREAQRARARAHARRLACIRCAQRARPLTLLHRIREVDTAGRFTLNPPRRRVRRCAIHRPRRSCARTTPRRSASGRAPRATCTPSAGACRTRRRCPSPRRPAWSSCAKRSRSSPSSSPRRSSAARCRERHARDADGRAHSRAHGGSARTCGMVWRQRLGRARSRVYGRGAFSVLASAGEVRGCGARARAPSARVEHTCLTCTLVYARLVARTDRSHAPDAVRDYEYCRTARGSASGCTWTLLTAAPRTAPSCSGCGPWGSRPALDRATVAADAQSALVVHARGLRVAGPDVNSKEGRSRKLWVGTSPPDRRPRVKQQGV